MQVCINILFWMLFLLGLPLISPGDLFGQHDSCKINTPDGACLGELLEVTGFDSLQVLWILPDGNLDSTKQIFADTTGLFQLFVLTESNDTVCMDSINISLPPVIEITGDSAICRNSTALLYAESSDSIINYSWNPIGLIFGSDTSQFITSEPLKNEVLFSLEVVDTNGCITYDSFLVQVLPLPESQVFTTADSVCVGGEFSIGLDTTPQDSFYSYEWIGPDNWNSSLPNPPLFESADTTQSGWYVLSVFDTISGCVGSDSILMTVLKRPEPAITGNGELCLGDSLLLGTAFDAKYVNVGTPTYSWSTGSIQSSLELESLFADTFFTLRILFGDSALGCFGSDTIPIQINDLPTLSFFGDTTICKGAAANIGCNSGTGAHEWEWFPSDKIENNDTLSPYIISTPLVSPTTFSIILTDTNNCQSTDSIMVNVLELPFVDAFVLLDTLCEGASIKLSADSLLSDSIISFSWIGPDSSWLGVGVETVNSDVRLEDAGIYTVIVTNNVGCNAADSVEVWIVEDPKVNIKWTPGCIGSEMKLDAELDFEGVGTINYLWSTGETKSSITTPPIIGPTPFKVTIVIEPFSLLGCDIVIEEVTVDAVQKPTAEIQAQFPALCKDQRAFYYSKNESSSNDFEQQWEIQPAAVGAIIDTLYNGSAVVVDWKENSNAKLVFTRGKGDCSASDTLSIRPGIQGTALNPSIIYYYPDLSHTFIVSDSTATCYQWWQFNPQTEELIEIQDARFQAYVAGNEYNPVSLYLVQMWHDENCTECPSLSTEVAPRSFSDNALAPERIHIFPNPCIEKLNVQIENPKGSEYRVVLHTLTGQTLLSQDLHEENNLTSSELDLKEISGGVYVVSFFSSSGWVTSKKIVVLGKH